MEEYRSKPIFKLWRGHSSDRQPRKRCSWGLSKPCSNVGKNSSKTKTLKIGANSLALQVRSTCDKSLTLATRVGDEPASDRSWSGSVLFFGVWWFVSYCLHSGDRKSSLSVQYNVPRELGREWRRQNTTERQKDKKKEGQKDRMNRKTRRKTKANCRYTGISQ